MNTLFTAEGFRALRASWILLGLAVAAAVAVGVGGHWITERDVRDGTAADKRVRDARTRLDGARRERDNLAESAEVFRALVERGILQDERRLDLVELVAELRRRHNLLALEYDIAPQRALPGSQFGSVEVLSSRVKLRARALHEGDLLAFVEELARSPRGLYPVDRCVMKRIVDQPPTTLQPRVEAECTLEWITLKEKKGAPRG
ncbi:hypothetical protein DSM104443_03702 [Usitatibacter rugosus]|uniref:Type II secretion system (T2SS) protein M subtype b n=1 Tax=Usitatibacter rugosus TaxID=2732067 RepID=A0A6M4GZF0_9PROT|nr:hypothetical protein [Usitatibacter rugosus]QJR12611.1 hypothetical protein DSM104443_03702 [Usitatibacter rugosus]